MHRRLDALFVDAHSTELSASHITQATQCSSIGSIATPLSNKPSGNYVAPCELSMVSSYKNNAANVCRLNVCVLSDFSN